MQRSIRARSFAERHVELQAAGPIFRCRRVTTLDTAGRSETGSILDADRDAGFRLQTQIGCALARNHRLQCAEILEAHEAADGSARLDERFAVDLEAARNLGH